MRGGRHLRGRFGRPRGLRRNAAIALLVLVGILAGGYFYIARPARLARITGDLLEQLSGAQVDITSAKFQFDGTIRLSDVTLSVPDQPADFGRLMHIDYIVIKHDMVSLLKASFHAQSMTFVNPVLYLTEDTQSHRFNYEALQNTRKDDKEAMNLPHTLPEVFLRGGAIRLGLYDSGTYTPETSLRINGTLTQHPGRRNAYFFSLRQELTAGQPGPSITGGFNLKHLTVSAKLEQFTLDPQHRNLLPYELRQWWDQFQPEGSFPAVSFSYDDPETGAGFRAQINVKDVNLTLPYGEVPTYMTRVTGSFTIENQTVETSLSGYFEDIFYQIDGRIDGFSRMAPFELTAQTAAFHLPDEPRYLLAMPEFAQRQFAKLSPAGTFEALVRIVRGPPVDDPKEPGKKRAGHIEYDGNVKLTDAKIVYEKFAYPLHGVRGELRFNNDQIEITSLRGEGPSGAAVIITGIITPPGKEAAVHMTISARNVPIDQVLYDALPSYALKVVESFGDEAAYARMIDEGLLQSGRQLRDREAQLDRWRDQRDQLAAMEQPDADALAALDEQIALLRAQMTQPVFDLGGTTSLTADVQRPFGLDKKYTITTRIEMGGLNMIFRFWPYPLRLTEGVLVIRPDSVDVFDIAANGLHGGMGKLSGQVILDPANRGFYDPQLQLLAVDLPIDDLLIATVPASYRDWIKQQNLAGVIEDATGRIFRDAEGSIDFHVVTNVSQVSAQPYGGDLRFSDVRGSLTFERKHLLLEGIEGKRDDADIQLDGQVSWIGTGALLDIETKLTNMPLDAALLNILPPESPQRRQMRALFDNYKLAGLFDADCHYRGLVGKEVDDAQSESTYTLAVRPKWLAMALRGAAIELTDIAGDMTIRPGNFALDDWTASYGSGRFRGTGAFGFGATSDIDLHFSASNDHLCDTTRAVLPDAVLRTIDSLTLTGSYDIDDAHLVYRPTAAQGPVLTFRGPVHLRDAGAVAGITLTEFQGTLNMDVVQAAPEQMPRLTLDLAATSLRASNRVIENASMHITNDQRLNRLDIESIYGHCYGGILAGHGTVTLGEQTSYRMSITAEDTAFTDIADPDAAMENTRETTGVLFARLDIEGMAGEPQSKRGRGAMEVRNARMYELPFALAVLQLANFTLPTSSSFDRAATQFLLDGDQIMLESIRFESPSVQMVGVGTMAYSTQQVDLTLYSRNAAGDLGPVSDLANVFKDELLNIHVTGTLEEPKTKVESFRGVADTWQRIFGPPQKDKR